MSANVDRMPLAGEQDVVAARQRARAIASLVGFDHQDQARIATAVSEIARNAVRYAHGGQIEFALAGDPCSALAIRVTDEGPGIPDLGALLDGAHRYPPGMGLGIVGARRLMDRCDIESDARGTRVAMTKSLDRRHAAPLAACIERVRTALATSRIVSPAEELQQQQRELLVALGEARERQEQLVQLNRELEDTNRGVVALYAELDEKALRLRQADETKSRFLSNMSHEFRTPLNSIRALAGLLLDRVDGPLGAEQAHQVELIRRAANDLFELVEDLLDIARIEAGKVEVQVTPFAVDDLFSALRGMLRPLRADDVALRFETPADLPPVLSDEGKVAQVLRNFISNALKFTERGSVTVSARRLADNGVEFSVSDTGIGIAQDDQERIFEEFVQVRGPLQRRTKGTGLGLPLCRRLAQALGGSVGVESTVGVGSRFFLSLPGPDAKRANAMQNDSPAANGAAIPVLVVANDDVGWSYERVLRGTAYRPVVAHSVAAARELIAGQTFAAAVVDRSVDDVVGHDVVGVFAPMPVLRIDAAHDSDSAAPARNRERVDRVALIEWLRAATRSRILIVEDDATARYAMRRLLEASAFVVIEAANGEDGLRYAVADNPGAIVLDLRLPDMHGFAMLDRLAASPATRSIPVVVCTSQELADAERAHLDAQAFRVLAKRDITTKLAAAVVAAAGARQGGHA